MQPTGDRHRIGRAPSGGVLWGAFGISRLHRAGVMPQRVLVIGSRSLLRVRAHRTALAQLTEDLADRIWLSTRRGLDVDVVWEVGHVLRAVLSGLAALRISRYDTVVLLAGPRPPGLGLFRGEARSTRLLRAILHEMSPSSRFLSVTLGADPAASGAPPAVEGGGDAGSTTAPLEIRPLSTLLDSPKTAAAAIARRLQLPRLSGAGRSGRAEESDDEPERERAVDALDLTGRPDDEHLQRLVERACDTFDTRFAELNVVGREVQWSLAAAGLRRGTRSTQGSLCAIAVRRPTATVMQDTLRELPVDRVPRMANGRLVRFYAGYPIQSIDGHRVGVLCVYDDRPHPLDDGGASALRDFALLAEARLMGV